MIQLLCPVCSSPLEARDGSYRCCRNHCYDISRYGYVNLLPASGHGKRHGDDKLMVRARSEFLSRGYYDPLSEAICDIAEQFGAKDPDVLDAGCGEGKYTADLQARLLRAGQEPDILGVDISKDALIFASRRNRSLRFAVASTSSLPVGSESVDILLNIFSPFFEQEFRRVLRKGGLMLRVFPLEDHLWELKAAVYEHPYRNDRIDPSCDGFELLEEWDVRYSITMDQPEDISALFKMTPYYYKTGAADQQKLEMLPQLTTRLEFRIAVCRKL